MRYLFLFASIVNFGVMSPNSSSSFSIRNNTCGDLDILVGFNDGIGCTATKFEAYAHGNSTDDSYGFPASVSKIVSIQAMEMSTVHLNESAFWYPSGCGTKTQGYIYGGCQYSIRIEVKQVSPNVFEVKELMEH